MTQTINTRYGNMLCQPHKEKVLLYSTDENSKLTQSKIDPYSILSKKNSSGYVRLSSIYRSGNASSPLYGNLTRVILFTRGKAGTWIQDLHILSTFHNLGRSIGSRTHGRYQPINNYPLYQTLVTYGSKRVKKKVTILLSANTKNVGVIATRILQHKNM